MASRAKRNTVNFNGKMVNIGVDMHKQYWRVSKTASPNTNKMEELNFMSLAQP
jgi:hypothetical protein